MAFRKELIPLFALFQMKCICMTIGLEQRQSIWERFAFLDEPLIGYRRHSSNVTQMTHGSIYFMIKKRIDIIRCLGLLKKRVRKVKA